MTVLLCNRLGKSFCYCLFLSNIKWDVIISSSSRLLLTVWIWYRCHKRIENYYHQNGEQSCFYKKVHIKTKSKRNDVLVIFVLQQMKNSTYTQENVKSHIQHGESWLRWTVIEQENCYFPLIFPKRSFTCTLSKPLRKK